MAQDEMQSLRERAEAMMRSAVEASSSGDRSAALLANDAALDVCRGLVRRSATPTDDDVTLLVSCLRNASTVRCALGRGGDALGFAQEAVAVCREHSGVFNLASCLNSLAVTYRAVGRLGDAIPATDEAVSVIWPEFESNPGELAETLDILLRNLVQWHQEAGQSPPAALVERFNRFSAKIAEYERRQQTAAANPALGEDYIAERLLSEVAKAATIEMALKGGSKIVGWACQLMELLTSLAWRIRGRHVTIRPRNDATAAPHWLVVLPSDSPEVVPLRALGAARNVMAELASETPSGAALLDKLAEALRAASDEDHLISVARSVENAGRAGTLTHELVDDVVRSLLRALRVTAVELEASKPKMADLGYVGNLAIMPVAAPLNPTPGEAMRVLAHVVEVTEHHFGGRIMAVV